MVKSDPRARVFKSGSVMRTTDRRPSKPYCWVSSLPPALLIPLVWSLAPEPLPPLEGARGPPGPPAPMPRAGNASWSCTSGPKSRPWWLKLIPTPCSRPNPPKDPPPPLLLMAPPAPLPPPLLLAPPLPLPPGARPGAPPKAGNSLMLNGASPMPPLPPFWLKEPLLMMLLWWGPGAPMDRASGALLIMDSDEGLEALLLRPGAPALFNT